MNNQHTQERIVNFIEDISQDVDSVRDKAWLKPAIISHCVCSLGIRREVIEPIVDEWWGN